MANFPTSKPSWHRPWNNNQTLDQSPTQTTVITQIQDELEGVIDKVGTGTLPATVHEAVAGMYTDNNWAITATTGAVSGASGFYTRVGNRIDFNFFLNNADPTGSIKTVVLNLPVTGLRRAFFTVGMEFPNSTDARPVKIEPRSSGIQLSFVVDSSSRRFTITGSGAYLL